MEFEYTKREWSRGAVYVPTLPICLNGFPIGHVLVDTGADATVLPMELKDVLGVDLDRERTLWFTGAAGENCKAIPSVQPIEYSVEQSGFRRLIWKGIVFFAEHQATALLGQYQCLSELRITLDGRKRQIKIE
ncbi:aspartyl protease family protein [Candidatus Peregrinibacteria bacterium]|nr:aspartyl protease family protein [Candidatus Peregrinibacteria bacterium]MBI3816976.1 aspartyl protease family protein [Candidatus Peregrinibacteria bacterium]